MRRGTAKLAVVSNSPAPPSAPSELLPPEQMLVHVVPTLIEAELAVAQLKQMLTREGRRLAKKRGVAFIREESLRREFGGA